MPARSWKSFMSGAPGFRRPGAFPIAAYSEFMPPIQFGPTPYGAHDPSPVIGDDPWRWHVSEYEEECELKPGLEHVAQQVLGSLVKLARGESAHGFSRHKLAGNPCWPPALEERAGRLSHERFVVLLPLALSRTRDDKGRIRWTLLGGSEQGPARAFWKSFEPAAGSRKAEADAIDFFRRLLAQVYDVSPTADLRHAGFRIHAGADASLAPDWAHDPLPNWTEPYQWLTDQPLRGVRFLLTFAPFGRLPENVQRAYLSGHLHLLPFPGSLLYWGIATYSAQPGTWPLAGQIPLLHSLARHEAATGIRIPQSGWVHEPKFAGEQPDASFGPLRGEYWRTHRNAAVLRDEPQHPAAAREEKLAHVLFSPAPEDVGLYDKPMARNAQIWTDRFELLLDGPTASRQQLSQAAERFRAGGLFGYRFLYPAMRVGNREVHWHRPLVAHWDSAHDRPKLLANAPLGYLTAYRTGHLQVQGELELRPRLLRRAEHLEAVHLFAAAPDVRPRRTTINVRKLLETRELLGGAALQKAFAQRLLTLPTGKTIEDWLAELPAWSSDTDQARMLVQVLCRDLAEPHPRAHAAAPSLTYEFTARRSFEVAYWKTIARLAHGRFLTKNNADCVLDRATKRALRHHRRDLDPLGEFLLQHHLRSIERNQMTGRALAGEFAFRWCTDFDFDWMGGWRCNQEQKCHERDLVVIIPGRDRSRAVILADHYDTAFMADHFEKSQGGTGARLAAPGADDNCSATATLLLAAPILLDLSRQGRLGCDVWLVHLTGEEFPADCLGARHLAQAIVEGTLAIKLPSGRTRDLSRTRIEGVFVMDMIAHNNDKEPDLFQISPGASRESMELALHAHLANEAWNTSTQAWNRRPSRRGRGRGSRSDDPKHIPATACHLTLAGEIRPHYDPRSTLYNTDGQIFSDAGIPVVLFMENYDINRQGYHDSQDTMANIDLDYGSALAAIAIETVARAASGSFSL